MRASPWNARRQLMAGMAVVALALFGVGSALAIQDFGEARRDAGREVAFEAGLAATAIGEALDETRDGLVALTADPNLPPTLVALAQAPQECSLSASGSGVFRSGAVHFFSPSGAILCSSVEPGVADKNISIGARPWFAATGSAEGPQVLDVDADPVSGAPSVGFAIALRTSDGALAGGILTTLDTAGLASELAKRYGGPEGSAFVVVSRLTSTVLSSSVTPELAGTTIEAGPAADARARIYRSAAVPSTGWEVSAGVEERVALADAREDLKRQAIMLALALLGTLQLGLYLYRRIARPIGRLSAAVEQASRDVTPEPLAVEGPAEIGRLIESFNELIQARAESDERYTHHTLHDSLTGLPNKVLFLDRVDTALRRWHRDRRPLAVLFVDLDRFGRVNDAIGHENGDRVLATIAQRIAAAVRPGDAVARFGADQFAVLCESLPPEGGTSLVAERIQDAVAVTIPVGTTDVRLTASVGIAIGQRGAVTADQLLREADTAMSRAKQKGRGRTGRYSESLHGEAVARLELETELKNALERDELVVHYQPIVNLATGRIDSVEALARWQHPTRGLLAPASFIPIAEETGLIIELGEVVLRRACAQAVRWFDRGVSIDVAVNCSAQQIAAHAFPHTVARVLAETGMDPKRLCLEVTESTLLDEVAVGDTLDRLKELGVSISVDDFGIGYSSLAYLQRFPIDRLKVDREFVSQITDGNPTLVMAIVSLGRALNLEVVAEGVEESAQLVLSQFGCQSAQGFYFSRAVPARTIERLVRTGFVRKLEAVGGRPARRIRAG